MKLPYLLIVLVCCAVTFLSGCNQIFSFFAPFSPSDVQTVAISPTSIKVSWANTLYENGFIVERRLADVSSSLFEEVARTEEDITTYTDEGLLSNTAYTYRIASFVVNQAGIESSKISLSISTAMTFVAETLPLAPTGLTDDLEQRTTQTVVLEWDDNADNEDWYEVARRDGSGDFQTLTKSAPRDATTYIDDDGLQPGTLYTYKIRAYNSKGYSFYCDEYGVLTDDTRPDSPMPVNNGATSESAPLLEWSDVYGAIGYQVQISRSTSFTDANILYDANVSESQFPVPDKLENDTLYYWRVRAQHADGNYANWDLSSIWNFTLDVTVFDVSFLIRDKRLGTTVADVEISIPSTGFSDAVSTATYTLEMDEGTYSIYFSAPQYRHSGLIFTVDRDRTVSILLDQHSGPYYDYEAISGVVDVAGTPLSTAFHLATGTNKVTDILRNITDAGGAYSTQSACGEIVVAAFTTTSGILNTLAYRSPVQLIRGVEQTGLNVGFSNAPTNYFGAKPYWGDLKVKNDSGFILAQQESSSPGSTYSFSADVLNGDEFILETVLYDDLNTSFQRKNAGADGGETNLTLTLSYPVFQTVETNGALHISVDSVAQASYFDMFVTQKQGENISIPVQISILADAQCTIPSGVVDLSSDEITIYVAAIRVPTFDVGTFLSGGLSYAEYEYAEAGSVLDQGGGAVSIMAVSDKTGYRKITGRNYVFSE